MVLKPQQYSSFRLVTQYDGVDPSVSGVSLTISLPNQRFLYLSITISKILLYLLSFRLVTQYDGVDPSVSECPLTISLPNQRFFILHTFNFYSVSFSFIYYLFFQLIISPFPITFIWFRNTNYLCLIANSCLNNFC